METQKSAIGLDGNIAALLGWIIGIIALVLIFIEKENKFVRFHAIQAVIYHVSIFVVYFIFMILVGILSYVSSFFAILYLFGFLIWLAWLGGMIFGAVKAYQGQQFKFPIIGDLAEKWA
jgi:uncharacterized membrane protein